MASKDWSEEEKSLLEKMRPQHTITEVFQAFKKRGFIRSRKGIERKACNMGIFYKGRPNAVVPNPDEYSAAWKEITEIKKPYTDEYRKRTQGIIPSGKKLRKILCLSDFHIPFDLEDLIHDAVKKHKDADILVVNGDLLDLYAISTWPKEKAVVLRKEYDIAMEYMKIFSKTFPRVILVQGNHEFRLNRYFHSNVSPSISFLVNKEILGRIANGEVYDVDGNILKKLNFDNVRYDGGPEAWFFQIGKTMFLHPKSYSKVAAKTSVQAWDYFKDREDIDCVVVSHTHHLSKVIAPGDRLCIEQGCLCAPMDYAKQGKLSYTPQSQGYCVIYQDEEGNTDFNKSSFVAIEGVYPKKKPSFEDLFEGFDKPKKKKKVKKNKKSKKKGKKACKKKKSKKKKK